jgi:hypothetical protein
MAREKPIYFELAGGLGNQMFGYVAGVYAARHLNTRPVFYYAKPSRGVADHGSSIFSFDLPYLPPGTTGGFFRIRKLFRLLLRRILLVFGLPASIAEILARIHVSGVIGRDPGLEAIKPGWIVIGYFQAFEYFQSIKEHLPSVGFELKKQSPWFRSMQLVMKDTGPIVRHGRRGDYLSEVNNGIGALSETYFQNALTLARKLNPGREIWIYSDDIPAARNMLLGHETDQFRFVSPPNETDAAESLVLMSLAPVLIISNSTFSWWAGALSSGAQVICPDPWFRAMREPEGLIPISWERLSSHWIAR